MTKLQLVQNLQKQMPGKSVQEINQLLNTLFEEIATALEQGKRLEIRGFGVFSIKSLKSYVGHNPKTGENISLKDRYLPSFKASKKLLVELK